MTQLTTLKSERPFTVRIDTLAHPFNDSMRGSQTMTPGGGNVDGLVAFVRFRDFANRPHRHLSRPSKGRPNVELNGLLQSDLVARVFT